MSPKDKILDRIQGCLLGGAIGDALGAPVEFMSLEQIKAKYGPKGIVEFDGWDEFPPGTYTDDTQMTIATAKGLIAAQESGDSELIGDPTSFIYVEYLKWLEMQDDPFHRRAPGLTCLEALSSGVMGTITKPINQSMGCGGMMRVAPVGLIYSPDIAFEVGCKAAAITHGHRTGYLCAGIYAALISCLMDNHSLLEACFEVSKIIPRQNDRLWFNRLVSMAADLSGVALSKLGKGFLADECLAISLSCVMGNSKQAILSSVNHGGDSDSTGAITGSMLGAANGMENLRAFFNTNLSDQDDEITSIARSLTRFREPN